MKTFPGWMNPLKCPEIDLVPNVPGAQVGEPPAPDRLLDYLYAPEVDRSPGGRSLPITQCGKFRNGSSVSFVNGQESQHIAALIELYEHDLSAS